MVFCRVPHPVCVGCPQLMEFKIPLEHPTRLIPMQRMFRCRAENFEWCIRCWHDPVVAELKESFRSAIGSVVAVEAERLRKRESKRRG